MPRRCYAARVNWKETRHPLGSAVDKHQTPYVAPEIAGSPLKPTSEDIWVGVVPIMAKRKAQALDPVGVFTFGED